MANEDQLQSHTQAVQQNLKTDQQFLIDATNEMHKYSEHLSTALGQQYNFTLQLKSAVQELRNLVAERGERLLQDEQMLVYQVETMVHLAQQMSKTSLSYEAIQTCHARHVPTALLPPAMLQQALLDIEKSLRSHGLKLAIPTSKLAEYYDVPIGDCTFAGQLILLVVKIPLLHRSDTFTLHNPIPIDFAYHNQTCNIDVLINVPTGTFRYSGGINTQQRSSQYVKEGLVAAPRRQSYAVTRCG